MPSLYHCNIVIEFPDSGHALTVNKSPDSDYECATLVSSHRQTASYLFRWFRNMKSSSNPDNAAENVLAMVEVFQSHKNELFASLREYILIEGIVMTCFQLQVDDGDLLYQVLNAMYNCWHSFGPLHFKAVIRRQGKSAGRYCKELISFFLEHARRKRMTFDGDRMVDVSIYSSIRKSPVSLSADVWCWKQLLVYLQYGARCEELNQDPTKSYFGVSSALTEILRNLVRHLWFRFLSPGQASFGNDPDFNAIQEYCDSLDADVKNLCRTLQILMRVIRRVRFRSLEFVIKDINGRNSIIIISSREIIDHCAVRVVVPKLYQRYRCPEELKHICRSHAVTCGLISRLAVLSLPNKFANWRHKNFIL